MDVSHNFRFCWNDHVPHLSQIFSDLRFEEVYCDTTLISDDGFVMKAHGAVLSATSRYFERVLSDVTSDQHPIIVLKGANFVELSCLLDYIYQGVTQVDQHLMESVLDVADMLEIKGLSKMKNNLSIKKLIAPSPTSSVVSRNSPLCSSPSKSPPPPSHASQSHSLSCPSSPNDTYAAPSAMFKMDTDDQSELNELNQKGKHTTFPDSRPPISSRLMDNHEYEANPPKQSSCSNSEYLDQTLGIDLSLSRATNDDNERASVKNFNLYEDSHLRKKKIMKFEEVNPSFPDLEWDKVGEKVEETVPLKKKKLYSRSVAHTKISSSCSQEETHKSSSLLTLEKLASILSRDKGKVLKCHSSNTPPKHKLIFTSDRPDDMDESSTETSLDSQLEVLCHDGALTISVTTDPSNQAPLKKAMSAAHVSLSLKKGRKKKFRNRREVECVKRECPRDDKAFPGSLLKRPNTRFYKRLKSYSTQKEALSIHCDLPFPADDSPLLHLVSSSKDKPSEEEEDDGKEEAAAVASPKHAAPPPRLPLGKGGGGGGRRRSCISPVSLFTLPPAKERQKQTRTSLTLQEKMKVVEAFVEGKSQRQIAHLHGIGKTQVNGIVRRRQEILSLYRDSVVRGEKLTMKRQRRSEYAALNEHLIKWYRHMTLVAEVKVTTGMLRAKALQISPQLGYHDFKASNGWLATFKANHNLKFSRAKKVSESCDGEGYEEDEGQKEAEFFEEDVEEEAIDMGGGESNPAQVNTGPPHPHHPSSVEGSSSSSSNIHSVGLHLGPMRGDPDSEAMPPSVQPPPPPVSNLSLGNSLLSSSVPLSKPPQMSNMTLGSNLAYNLTREHPRTDLTHLSDLHSASAVNAPTSLSHPPHPSLSKPPEGPLSYKTEDTLSYGYDTQGRMNEGATRGTEYNYTHYGFPSTYYGYHFLGQY